MHLFAYLNVKLSILKSIKPKEHIRVQAARQKMIYLDTFENISFHQHDKQDAAFKRLLLYYEMKRLKLSVAQ